MGIDSSGSIPFLVRTFDEKTELTIFISLFLSQSSLEFTNLNISLQENLQLNCLFLLHPKCF